MIPVRFTSTTEFGPYQIDVLEHQELEICVKVLLRDYEIDATGRKFSRYRAGILEFEEGIGNRKVLITNEVKVMQGGFYGAYGGASEHTEALAKAQGDYGRVETILPLFDFYITDLTPVY